MVQVDYNHDTQFLEVNSKYVDLIQRKMFYPLIDNPGLQLVQETNSLTNVQFYQIVAKNRVCGACCSTKTDHKSVSTSLPKQQTVAKINSFLNG